MNCRYFRRPATLPWDISLYEPSRGLLFTGDFLLEKTFSLFSTITHSDFDDFVRSLERIKNLRLSVVLPGHGRPVNDPGRAIDHVQNDLAEKEKAIAAMLKRNTQTTAYDIACDLLSADGIDFASGFRYYLGLVDTYLMKLVRDEQVKQIWKNGMVSYAWNG